VQPFRLRFCGGPTKMVPLVPMGEYHTANIAFRQPDAVSHLISLSGSFDISSFSNGYHDDNIYLNSPYEYLPTRPTLGNTMIWTLFWAPAKGTRHAMNPIAWPLF
jgi:hypothetical protein